MNNELVIGGKYRHYKNMICEVMGVCNHSETLEKMVIYKEEKQNTDGLGPIWVRPYDMFLEEIPSDLQIKYNQKTRFEYMGNK